MLIQIYSDLHIEFGEFEASADEADVVVFAGDIDVGKKGVNWLQQLGLSKPILYVLGNHEYYKHTYQKLLSQLQEETDNSTIHLLENKAVTIGEVTFHGCTLWSDFAIFGNSRMAMYECEKSMNDFAAIRTLPKSSKLRAMDVLAIHRTSLNWLQNSLHASSTQNNVVVTHHAPSLKSVPEQYKNDPVTGAFASNLEEFINCTRPNLWLHGHLHNSSDYEIGGCRVVCNPRGYKGDFNSEFSNCKLLEVG